MTSSRDPGLAFWATAVVVVVLVAYAMSIGPVWWLRNKPTSPTFVHSYWIAYRPFAIALRNCPHWISGPIECYLAFCDGQGKLRYVLRTEEELSRQ